MPRQRARHRRSVERARKLLWEASTPDEVLEFFTLTHARVRVKNSRPADVAYVLIDAVIDLAWTRQRWPDAPDEFFIKPAAIAEEIWHVAHQDRSAWSFNVEIRPFGETW